MGSLGLHMDHPAELSDKLENYLHREMFAHMDDDEAPKKGFYLSTQTEEGWTEEFFDHAADRDQAYHRAKDDGKTALLCPKADLTDRNVEIKVTAQERDMIIAALRMWQDQSEVDPILLDIAENERGHGGVLSDDEIDALIEDAVNV